jgi:hypothetical protein
MVKVSFKSTVATSLGILVEMPTFRKVNKWAKQ